MVPAPSIKVPRVSMYSGSCHVNFPFAYGAFTLSGWLSQNHSARIIESIMQSEPHGARTMVWALPRSLAATYGIDVSFSSSGYLDVSVHRVPLHTLWIGVWIHEVFSCGFPHSEICGSMDICSLPQLIAAYHVFHRLLVPRHPPCALLRLTSSQSAPLCSAPVNSSLTTFRDYSFSAKMGFLRTIQIRSVLAVSHSSFSFLRVDNGSYIALYSIICFLKLNSF